MTVSYNTVINSETWWYPGQTVGYLLLKHIWSNTGKHGVASARSASALFGSPPALFAIKLSIGSTLHCTSNLPLDICVCCQTSSITWVNQSGFTGNNTNASRESEFRKLRDAETSHRRAEGNCKKNHKKLWLHREQLHPFMLSFNTRTWQLQKQFLSTPNNLIILMPEYSGSQSKLI